MICEIGDRGSAFADPLAGFFQRFGRDGQSAVAENADQTIAQLFALNQHENDQDDQGNTDDVTRHRPIINATSVWNDSNAPNIKKSNFFASQWSCNLEEA